MAQNDKIAVLSDFDGTILYVDTGALVLEKFGVGDWKIFDTKLEKGEISLEECLSTQFGMIRAQKKEILDMIEQERLELRPDFHKLVEYCKGSNFPFMITSGGIDFCIEEVLRTHGFGDGLLNIHSGKSKYTEKGFTMTFPAPSKKRSANFKEDLVNHYHDVGYKVVYIGDGVSDFEPSMKADLVFTVNNSRLERMCHEKMIRHTSFGEFNQVVKGIKDWISLLPDTKKMEHLE
jgi:2-hydroxy-3-keto-5-methylthiopentenyl-1-phosphate phosphatase